MRGKYWAAMVLGAAAVGFVASAGAARADTIYTYSWPGNSALGDAPTTLTLDTTTGAGTYVGGSIVPSAFSWNVNFTFNPSNVTFTGPPSDPTVSISSINISGSSYVVSSARISYYNAAATTNANLQMCVTQCSPSLTPGTTGNIILNGVFGNGQNAVGDEFRSITAPWSAYTPPSDTSSSTGGTTTGSTGGTTSTSSNGTTGGTDVPEPGMLGLLALGSGGLVWRRRRARSTG